MACLTQLYILVPLFSYFVLLFHNIFFWCILQYSNVIESYIHTPPIIYWWGGKNYLQWGRGIGQSPLMHITILKDMDKSTPLENSFILHGSLVYWLECLLVKQQASAVSWCTQHTAHAHAHPLLLCSLKLNSWRILGGRKLWYPRCLKQAWRGKGYFSVQG